VRLPWHARGAWLLAFPLPAAADFDLGASIGIPAVTAHRALTVAEDGPARLQPNALAGRTVLVAGGAGAVGNAAVQLARWAGATVIATVSGDAKAQLATAAGAHHVINYKDAEAAAKIRRLAPDGGDLDDEVAAGRNAELDLASLRRRGTISIYANDGSAPFSPDVRRNMGLNARYQFVLLYTAGWDRITAAAADINQAIEDGAFQVGEQSGLPLHRFPLEDTAAATRLSASAARSRPWCAGAASSAQPRPISRVNSISRRPPSAATSTPAWRRCSSSTVACCQRDEQAGHAELVVAPDQAVERTRGHAGLPRPFGRRLTEEDAGAHHLVGALLRVLDEEFELLPVVRRRNAWPRAM
jgi:hypothetical protein